MKDWSLAEAQEHHRPELGPTSPFFQWVALHELDREQQRFEAGESMALFGAIRKCANHDLPLPQWAAKAFISGYDEVLSCRVGTWDEAFGTPYPKNANLGAMRKRRTLSFSVFAAVRELNKSGLPIDAALFERVGSELKPPVSASTARDLYYLGKRRFAFCGKSPKTRSRKPR